MDQAYWDRLQDLFKVALAMEPEKRARFLEESCGGDVELRKELERLLGAYKASDNIDALIERASEKFLDDEWGGTSRGRRIGAYEIKRKLGSGGMSAVYLATRADDEYQKRVAIKIVKRDMNNEEILRRFRQERQILASLDHPNIARMLDGGTTEDGLPYFVMEYIEGMRIDEYCDSFNMPITDRLKLFRRICDAIHYAHQNLVVHRDLKPGNILVTQEGIPKLLDFGIAKLVNPELASPTLEPTATWMRLMTPGYASPEQVKGMTITTVSDIYSLGVLLYELLTGHQPYHFNSSLPQDIERVVCGSDPEKPSTAIGKVENRTDSAQNTTTITPESVGQARGTQPGKLQRRLEGDLDNIVLMAVRKEPQRRYQSAAQLSEDIRRYLEGLPVMARKDTFRYRLGKFVQRYKVAVAVSAAFAALVISFLGITTYQSIRMGYAFERADLERAKAEQAVEFLVELFKEPDPDRSLGDKISAREILERGSKRIYRELGEQPEVQAKLIETMGLVYRNLGELDRAEELFTDALEIRKRIFGEDHVQVATSLHHLGLARFDKGLFDDAEELLRKALTMRERLLPRGHTDIVESLTSLGMVKQEKSEYDTAEQLFREALALRQDSKGKQRLELATIEWHLGYLYHTKGDYALAEPLYRDALKIRQDFYGDIHPKVTLIKNHLAWLFKSMGDYAKAEPLYNEVLEQQHQIYGEDHPEIAHTLNNLGALYYSKGELKKAEEAYRKCLKIEALHYGEEHPTIIQTRNNLASLLYAMGDFSSADQIFQETLNLRIKVLGENHPTVAQSMNNLAMVRKARGQYDEAETLLLKALAIWEGQLGRESPSTSNCIYNLASLAQIRGDYKTAEKYLHEALEIQRKILPPDHPSLGDSVHRLGTVLLHEGRKEEALPLLEEAQALFKKKFPEGHWRRAVANDSLAACLMEFRRYEEAEKLMKSSYPVLLKTFGKGHERTQLAVDRFIKLYESWGKPDKAIEYRGLVSGWAGETSRPPY